MNCYNPRRGCPRCQETKFPTKILARKSTYGDRYNQIGLTAYHAKLYAHELTKRSSSDSVDELLSALSDA